MIRRNAPHSTDRENNTRTQDKFVIRLPEGMRPRIKDRGEHLHLSMNSVIIDILEEALDGSIVTWIPSKGQTVVFDEDQSLWTIKRVYGTATDPRMDVEDPSGRYGTRIGVAVVSYRPLTLNV